MMKPAFCKKHDLQNFIATSPLLGKVASDGHLNGVLVKKFRVYSHLHSRWNEYWVDHDYLAQFFPDCSDGEISLEDRNIPQRQLNDRLLIRKIMSGMRCVCPVCLSEVIAQRSDHEAKPDDEPKPDDAH